MKRALLRYHGGKFRLAPWVCRHLPPHRIYVEPFCGAASILLAKPRSYAEVLNDLDDEIVNLFTVLRDPAAAKDLTNALRLTPYARSEFLAAHELTGDPIEDARRLVIRSFMGFGSAACNRKHKTGFRNNTTRTHTTPAVDWRNYPDALPVFVERLRGVVIEHKPAVELIPVFDGPDTLIYVDPPYVLSTRSGIRWEAESDRMYAHEMSDDDHRALAAVLQGVSGMVVLSGYRCDLYDELFASWRRIDRTAFADGARRRTESLWFNAAAATRQAQRILEMGGV